MEEKGSKCQVRRTGRVIRVAEQNAVIAIGGRNVEVPLVKVSPQVKAGDEVIWTGSRWATPPA